MRVAIAGVAESDLGEVTGKTILQMQAEAALAALADAGLQLRDVDGIATAGGEGIYAPGMLLAEYLGVQPRYTDSTNIGGASFFAHAGHASYAIRSSQCQHDPITHPRQQRSPRPRTPCVRGAGSVPLQFARALCRPAPVGAYAP